MIVDPRPSWPAEADALANEIRELLGHHAERIDHIGSTAVPGLPAKDVIDLQATLAEPNLDEAADVLHRAGFTAWPTITSDHRPPGPALPLQQLTKRMVSERPGARRANIHLRVAGRFNQRDQAAAGPAVPR